MTDRSYYRKKPGGALGQVEQVTITIDDDNQNNQPLPDIETAQRVLNTATPTAILKTDGALLFDTTSTAIAIDLPLASVGKIRISFKDVGCNSVANNITFNATGADSIVDTAKAQTSTIIASDGHSGYFLSNGVDTWYLF